MLNFYSLIHFFQYLIVGKFLLISWKLFLIISLGWEILELALPFEFAIEAWANKSADILINCLGFYLGVKLRKK